jgi:hypothetical protein
MNDEARLTRLRDAGNAVAAAGANSAEVIAALDATFSELPGPLDVPDDSRARLAIAQEVVGARVELIAANGALAALTARKRELLAPLGTDADVRTMRTVAPELEALEVECRRQRDRVSVLETVLRDLDSALARFRARPA